MFVLNLDVSKIFDLEKELLMLKPKKKFTKKELREDKFVTATFKTQAYLQDNQTKVVTIVVSVLALLLIIIWAINNYQDEKMVAGEKITEAGLLVQEGNKAEGIAILKQVAAEYSNSEAGYAAFLLGKDYLEMGYLDSAQTFFEMTLDYTDDPILVAPANMNLGSIYYADSSFASAADMFQQAYDEATFDALKADALLNAGIATMESGDMEEAKILFEKLISEFPTAVQSTRAKLMMAMDS